MNEEKAVSQETEELVKRLDKGIRSTFIGMRTIFLVMKECGLSPQEMGDYIATITGRSTKGSMIDVYVYDSIIGALDIFQSILEKRK